MSYWYVLLEGWQKQGHDGFSIPFLIGSQTYLQNQFKSHTIEDLFASILQARTPPICLKYCLTIEDIILEIKNDAKTLVEHFPLYKGKSQSQLFLTKFLLDLGDDCDTIIATLSARYRGYVENKEFSINNRKRGNYTPDESSFIRESFKYRGL